MPLRNFRGLLHVSSAPAAGGGRLPLRVVPMDGSHARWWDENIRPYILALPHPRADQDWRWRRILGGVRLVGGGAGQQPSAFVVGVERAGDEFWPCVMTAMVERYPHLPDHSRASVFLWYISPAPETFFLHGAGFGAAEVPKGLMSIGMDVAVTQSYNTRLYGRVGLHADSRGGEDLVQWYESPKRGGMIRLSDTLPLPGLRALRGNDGRYFYHDETTAFQSSIRMDAFRGRGA